MTGSGGVFVSYRRSDTAAATGRLTDLLLEKFGAARVFIDVDTVAPGEDFVKRINRPIGACHVLLAPIGSRRAQTNPRPQRGATSQPDHPA